MTEILSDVPTDLTARGPSRFFVWTSLLLTLLAVIGFSRSYYLKVFFGTPALSGVIHVHALIMTSWLALLITQTLLISKGFIQWHRRVGVAGAVLAAVVIVVGMHATLAATQREVQHHVVGPFHFLLALNAANLLTFGALVVAAIVYRFKADFHKRLMVLATLNLIAPALARIVLLFTHDPHAQIYFYYFCVIAFVAVDTVAHRRLHPACAWGALLTIVIFQASVQLVSSSFWLPFVNKAFS